MSQLLSRLSAANLLTLLAAFLAGLVSWCQNGVRSEGAVYPVHFFLGLAGVLLTLAVHCLVFSYFLGTGRWVKEVALTYRLPDDPLPKETRVLKRRAFPPALLAMLVPIAAAAAGMAVQRQLATWRWHLPFALATLAVNAWATVVELRCVRANGAVLDAVLVEVDRLRAEAGLVCNAEALHQAEAE